MNIFYVLREKSNDFLYFKENKIHIDNNDDENINKIRVTEFLEEN